MAGRGMGAATRGGGAVEKGPKNRMLSEPSMKTQPVPMMAKGGEVINQHKRMAMGMAGGGMMTKGYAAGGMMKKGYAGGGAVKKKMAASGGKSR